MLWWKIHLLTIGFDHQKRLVKICNFLFVHILEILCHCDIVWILLESMCNWILFKAYCFNDIGPLSTPVCHDTCSEELNVNSLLPAIIVSTELLSQIINLFQTSIGRHKLKNSVDCNCESKLCMLDWSFKSWEDHKSFSREIYGLV